MPQGRVSKVSNLKTTTYAVYIIEVIGKEIASKFSDSPKTKTAWLSMGLGITTLFVPPFLGIFAAVIRPIIDKASSENTGAAIGFGVGIVVLVLSVSALVLGIIAYKKGERSWALWVGFIPAILVCVLFILMLIGEFIFPH